MTRTAPAAILCLALAAAAPAAAEPEPVVAYTIVNGAEIPDSLTGESGNAARGWALFLAARTGCTACHSAPGIGAHGPAGEASPRGPDAVPLDGVGARLSAGAIRLWLVAPEAVTPGVGMPAYYAPGQRTGENDPLFGGPRLTAGEIEDLVAWLSTLKAEN